VGGTGSGYPEPPPITRSLAFRQMRLTRGDLSDSMVGLFTQTRPTRSQQIESDRDELADIAFGLILDQ
jgi:hypothetical protein